MAKDAEKKVEVGSAATRNKGNEPGAGIRALKTTGVFRAVNFELYARPVSDNCKIKITVFFRFIFNVVRLEIY